jgi:hypothetical protein
MLLINVASTYFSFKHDLSIGTWIERFNLSYFVNKYLADYTYDPREKRYKTKYQYAQWYQDTQEVRLPRQLLDVFLSTLNQYNVRYEIRQLESYTPIEHGIYMNPMYQDRPGQTDMITYLSNPALNMASCDLQTSKGKAQPLYSRILTPKGFVPMGSLSIGDEIYGQDGQIHHVTGIYPQGVQKIYRITFNDHTQTDCTLDHLWNIQNQLARQLGYPFKTVSLREIIDQRYLKQKETGKEWHPYIPLPQPIQFPEQEVPIDPYLLGCLIGDGSWQSVNRSLSFNNSDPDIVEKVSKLLQNLNAKLVSVLIKNKYPFPIAHPSRYYIQHKHSPIRNLLKELHFNSKSSEKFIPYIYKCNSINVRLKMIQGLMDTKGQISKTGYNIFYTSSKQLVDDFTWIIRSLGGTAKYLCLPALKYKYKGEIRTGCPKYRVFAKLPAPYRIATSEKHTARIRPTYRKFHPMYKQIHNIEYAGMTVCQCISTDASDGLYVTDDFVLTHNTYIAIKSATILKYNFLVISNNLSEQWRERILEYTTTKEDDIEFLGGIDSIDYIWNRIHTYHPPKIILASIQTIMNYISRKDAYVLYPSIQEMMKGLGIGCKISDEHHLNFKANVILDLSLNIKYNRYLTATFMRTDRSENKVFKNIYNATLPDQHIDTDKYTDVIMYRYSLGVKIKYPVFRTINGYSHSKYEKYLLKNPIHFGSFIDYVLVPLVDRHFIYIRQPPQRCIVFADTIAFCQEICKALSIVYPELTVKTKVHTDPESNLQADIIVTTLGSTGTGSDLQHLLTIFNTLSYQSEVYCIQSFGRLRKLQDAQTYYIDMYNSSINDQVRHKYMRTKVYERIANSIVEAHINC